MESAFIFDMAQAPTAPPRVLRGRAAARLTRLATVRPPGAAGW